MKRTRYYCSSAARVRRARVSGGEGGGPWEAERLVPGLPPPQRTRTCRSPRLDRVGVWRLLVLTALASLLSCFSCISEEQFGPLVTVMMAQPRSLFQVPASRQTVLQVEDKARTYPARGTPVRMGRRPSSQTLRQLSVPAQAPWVLMPLQVWLLSMTT